MNIHSIKIINSVTLVGGTSSNPITSQGIRNLAGAGYLRGLVDAQGLGQVLVRVPVRIGNGTTETYYDGSDRSLEFGDPDGVYFQHVTSDLSLTLALGATDTYKATTISAAVGGVNYDLSTSNGSATYDFSNTTISGMTPTLNTSIAIDNQKFSNCGLINGGSGTYTNLTVQGSLSTTSAMTISSGADLTGSSFTKGAETYAIELTNAGSYDLSGCTFTGYTTELNVTASSGTVTITLGDGQSNPSFTTAGATVNFLAPQKTISITSIVAGSRLQIYNVTTATETYNAIVAGTSYSANYNEGSDFSAGDTVRVRLTYCSGVTAQLPFSLNTLASTVGWSVVADQMDDTVYNNIAIDGSTITKFTADYVNDEVDLTIASNFTGGEWYAWWVCNLHTAQGISDFFGGVDAEDDTNFKIVTSALDMRFDNTTSSNVYQSDNRRIYRDDNAYPVKDPTTGGGGIDLVWKSRVFAVTVGSGSLTPSQEATLNSRASQVSVDNLSDEVPTTATIADAVWDEVLTGASHNDPTSAGRRLRQASVWLSAEGQLVGTPTTTSLQTNLTQATTSFYSDQAFIMMTGVLAGQARVVESYNGTTKTCTFDEPWTVAPSAGDEFAILANHVHSVSKIQAGLATASNVTDAQTAIITEVNANETKIDLLETKAQADARQALLIAEHDATQATLSGVSTFNPAVDVVANVTLVDTVTTNTDMVSLTGIATSTNVTDAQTAITSTITTVEGKVDTTVTNTNRVDALIENVTGDRFTAKALETSPTAEMDASELHSALDSYANKDDWKASAVDLSSVLTAIGNLNDLSTADIDARLLAYDAPTLTEMTAAFTEIKGATWTTTDTLEAIRDAVTNGAITAVDIWSYNRDA